MAKANLLAMGWAASQFGFLCIAGLLGGIWLDRKIGTMPLFALFGLGLGLFGGIRVLLAVLKSANNDE